MPKFEINNTIVEAFQLSKDVAKGKSPIPEWAKDAATNSIIKIVILADEYYAIVKTFRGYSIIACPNDWIIMNENKQIYTETHQKFLQNYTEIICYELLKKQ